MSAPWYGDRQMSTMRTRAQPAPPLTVPPGARARAGPEAWTHTVVTILESDRKGAQRLYEDRRCSCAQVQDEGGAPYPACPALLESSKMSNRLRAGGAAGGARRRWAREKQLHSRRVFWRIRGLSVPRFHESPSPTAAGPAGAGAGEAAANPPRHAA